MYRMDAIAFSKHIQCTREAKQDCLFTVRQLVELAYAAREEGLLKMDSLAEDTVRFPDPLLRQAAHLVAEVSGADRVRKVLYNYIPGWWYPVASETAQRHYYCRRDGRHWRRGRSGLYLHLSDPVLFRN